MRDMTPRMEVQFPGSYWYQYGANGLGLDAQREASRRVAENHG